MSTQERFLALLFAVSLAQAAFLTPVVANLEGVNRRATRLLALLLLCFLPMLGEELISTAGLATRFPHSVGSSIAFDLLIAPLLLFYARSLTDRERHFDRRDLLHLLPFGLALLVLSPFYVLDGAEKLATVREGLPASFKLVIAAKIPVAAAYLWAVIRDLNRFVKRADDVRARDPNVVWLLRSMIALAALAALFVATGLLQGAGVPISIDTDTLGTLFIGGSIYLISFLLIRHPIAALAPAGAALVEPLAPSAPRTKYRTSPLSETQKQAYLGRLLRHMEEERPFLDMELNLEKLSEPLEMRPGHLSQVLNEGLGVNFYEFLNQYRVREAQARIADPRGADRTLLTIAFDSGFNSKASFNRAFKRVTGQTPSQYARARSHGASNGAEPPQSIE